LRRKYQSLENIESFCECGEKLSTAGPLWAEKFSDQRFCKKLSKEIMGLGFEKSLSESKLVDLVSCEQNTLIPYYNFHKVCSVLGKQAPKRAVFFDELRSRGYRVSETHFSPLGVRSNAPYETLLQVI